MVLRQSLDSFCIHPDQATCIQPFFKVAWIHFSRSDHKLFCVPVSFFTLSLLGLIIIHSSVWCQTHIFVYWLVNKSWSKRFPSLHLYKEAPHAHSSCLPHFFSYTLLALICLFCLLCSFLSLIDIQRMKGNESEDIQRDLDLVWALKGISCMYFIAIVESSFQKLKSFENRDLTYVRCKLWFWDLYNRHMKLYSIWSSIDSHKARC